MITEGIFIALWLKNDRNAMTGPVDLVMTIICAAPDYNSLSFKRSAFSATMS